MPPEGDVDLTIRRAQPGDAAVLAQLMCELGYETTKSEMQMRMERIAADDALSARLLRCVMEKCAG
jgi:hypothetical protein